MKCPVPESPQKHTTLRACTWPPIHRQCRHALDPVLNGVCDVGHDLHRLAQVVPPPFPLDHRLHGIVRGLTWDWSSPRGVSSVCDVLAKICCGPAASSAPSLCCGWLKPDRRGKLTLPLCQQAAVSVG